MNNDFYHKWVDSAIIFMSDESREIIAEWPHEWQKKKNFHSNSYIILFLTHYFMTWKYKPTETNQLLISPRTVFSDCDVTTIDQWRHMNWYCDIIFIDCSCTQKLASSWSSVVNYNHDYQFPAIRYSLHTVKEILPSN